MAQPKRVEDEGTNRIDSLSDGVFAIVLTLLVLQFEVPTVPPTRAATDLFPQLLALQPLMFSYILSFFVVGLYWVVHHNLFQLIHQQDRRLLYLNLIFLLFVSFSPFPTELLGVYTTQLTWVLYASNIAIVGLLMTGIWWYAIRCGLTSTRIDEQTARLTSIRGLISPLVFILSIMVSFISLDFATLTPLLIVPLQMWWVRTYGTGKESV